MSENTTDKPKLTWIDIAITVTLLASIVGLAAWLISGKFSYVAAPASSFGLVHLLRKPKDEETNQADTPNGLATTDEWEQAQELINDRDSEADHTEPIATVSESIREPTHELVNNPSAGIAAGDRVESDPFDGSLLEPEPPTAPDRTVNPPAATASPSEQPIRYLSEQYEQGQRNFQGFDLRNVMLNYRVLRLIGVDLREVKAERAQLQQIDLTQANLGRADLQYAKLDGANLSYTNLSAANLSGASLCGVNLRDAKLTDARLAIADLSYADLSGADLSGADLTDTNLYRARLDGTKLPDTLRR